MNTKRDWTKVSLFVVLALTSLSSVAMAAPSALDLCGVSNISPFDQYRAAIEWAEQGGSEVPFALSVSCVEQNVDSTARTAGHGVESWDGFEQQMAAIEAAERAQYAELFPSLESLAAGTGERWEQYQAAIESAERAQVAELFPSLASLAEGTGLRWEQYWAAIESAEPELSRAVTVLRSVRVPTFAPEPPTGENKLEYVPCRAPTFAPERPTGENKLAYVSC